MCIHQALHTETCITARDGGASYGILKRSAQLPISLGTPGLIFIFHLYNIIQLVHNSKIRLIYKSAGKHNHQLTSRKCGGPNKGSLNSSYMEAPNWYQNWCQSDGNRCKIIPQPLPWHSVGITGEGKEEEIYFPCKTQRKHFTPFLVSVDGILRRKSKILLKQLARCLA